MKKIMISLSMSVAFVYLSSCGEGIQTEDLAGGASSTEPPVVSFTVQVPDLSDRDVNVFDEAPVSWSTNADKVECSRDGGTTFTDCTADGSFQWSYADLNQQHVIKASLTGATEDYEYSFTPATIFSGTTFVECDVTVSSDEDFNAFEARLTTADQVICIEDGVTVSNSDVINQDEISFAESGITLIARRETTARFVTNKDAGVASEDSIFNTGGGDNISLIGLWIERNNPGGVSIVVPSTSSGIAILNNNILQDGGGNDGSPLITDAGGIMGAPTLIKGNSITASSSTAIDLSGSMVVLTGNTVVGKYRSIASRFGSVISSEGNSYTFLPDMNRGSVGVISVSVGDSLSVSGDSIYDGNGDHVFEISSSGGDTTITLASTRIVRLNTLAMFQKEVFDIGGTSANGVYAGDSNNVICSVANPPTFTGLYSAGSTNAGDFSAAHYGGSIAICP